MAGERTNPAAEELYARKWPIFGVTMIGLFMALIDVTIVNLSIPELQRELDAPVDTVSWVLNAYNIMFAVLLVAMGRLADQFGRRTFFLAGMALFTLASLLCTLAGSIDALIAFRVLQGVGAGMLAPIALATTTLVFPPHQRGMGLALMAVVANVAAALGPVIGGVLLEFASWQWIFAINLPIGVLGIVLALRVMPQTYDLGAGTRVDLWGMLTIGGSIFCLTYALVEANDLGWGSSTIVGLLGASVVLALAFAATQRLGRYPMLTRSLVRNRQFVGACAAMALFAVALMGMLFLSVIAFVNLWGYSNLEAAFAIAPVAILGFITSPIVGRFSDRTPPRVIAVPALALVAGGLLWFSSFPTSPDYLAVLPALILIGIGVGAIFPAVNVGAMGSIAGQELGLGSGIVNTSRQVGFALGVAILVAVFTGAVTAQLPEARARAATQLERAAIPAPEREAVLRAVFVAPDAAEGAGGAFKPRSDVERRVDLEARQLVRDAFADGWRVAALAALLALPFSLLMRSTPVRPEVGGAAAAG